MNVVDAIAPHETAEGPELVARMGPFVVSRVLGRGGMGVVYAGTHEHTGVEAAVKTVGKGSEMLMSYVRREATTLSRIRHPGVVQILGFGVDAGRSWYAMELLSGRTFTDLLAEHSPRAIDSEVQRGSSEPTAEAALEQILAARQADSTLPNRLRGKATTTLRALGPVVTGVSSRPPVPAEPAPIACDLPRILPILRGVCDALAFVHGEGVIHRDLKPDNILLRGAGLPVLVDFGLAADVGGDSRDVLQNVGGVAGSLNYMAPEQLLGELLDARCDLYALGCILYRAVTGRLPFEGVTEQVIAGHLLDVPLAPGRLVKLPAALDDLISGLLAKDRDHRVGSAEAVDGVLAAVGGATCRWPTPPPQPRTFLYRPPFVGRRDVFDRLVERLRRFVGASEAAQAEPPGGLVLIAGESGAGKTRLALEAVKLGTESSASIVTCGCMAGGSPFQPLRELFQALAEHCLAVGPGEVEDMFGAGAAVLALYSPEIAALPGVAALPEPDPLPSAAARARVFDRLTDALRAFARARPLLLFLDDIHLADSLTLEFLAHFQRHLREQERGAAPRMLVLGCYRSEERGPALAALAADPGALHLAVERMNEVEVGQMVRGMLALADPPPAFVAFLARESGGNPFFVAEYLRTAVAERVLVRDARGRWKFAETSTPTEAVCEALPLPRSLREVVELRLGKLTARTREILDAAAAIGGRFTATLLGEVVALGPDALLEALDEMVAAQVIEPVDGKGYAFVHDKLHELPSAALEPARRRDLHARIAAAMERLHADAIAEHEGIIGRHWALAGDPARAAPRLHAAGDHARRIHSVDAAIELYRAARRQVQQILDSGADARASWRARACELDEKLGDALAFSGQHQPARAAFVQVLADLEAAPAVTDDVEARRSGRVLRARLVRKIAKSWESVHAYPEALAEYAALEQRIAEAPEFAAELEPEWIQLMLGRAWIYYWSSRIDEMNVVIDRVRPIIEVRGSALDRYRFYLALVTRDYRRDRYRIAAPTLDSGRACVAAAREANGAAEITFARFVLGFGLLFAGHLEQSEAELEAALQAARKIGDAVAETRAIAYLALVHYLAGHLAEAGTTATTALTIARARKMGDYEGMSLALLGRVARANGDHAGAAELCRQAIATWNAMTYPFPFRWLANLVLLEQDGPAPAGERARLARELTAQSQAHLPDPLDAALREAAAADERGDAAAVERSIEQAVALAAQLGYLRR